ncbi:hypothetical protein [Kineobactrum salinum]|uniref:SRPBCC family protein n=1 Tax=Kineobactrum salinum TaxID=2708301 RepID=A0A6C0TXP4_9GAMM|nr:hypothetical protein [Kineobactrum salinum]QIB64546.1 hypothetical protein G3T16_03155 [Kineobactrum salinum]
MMMQSPELSHCVTALVNAPAIMAFDFLSDPMALGRWSIGCMNTLHTDEEGVYVGRSLFSDAESWFSIDARPELMLIDYRIGIPASLVPRISVRVIPHEVCDLAENQCYVTLTSWRTSKMSMERWQALSATHEAEIWLIKSQIENCERGNVAGP